MFSTHVVKLVELALAEDLGGGDVTTQAIFSAKERSRAKLVAKADLVLAGAGIFSFVMDQVSKLPGAPQQESKVRFVVDEGQAVKAGAILAELEGATLNLLRGERVGLNFLQRMCGVATKTRAYAEALGDKVSIVDTRKTTPGWRELEKYSVKVGGGRNHRINLAGGVLIKENHIRAAGGIAQAVAACRDFAPHTVRLEIETTNLDEVKEALDAGVDIIMLDNMSNQEMTHAISLIQGRALVEASGNITLERLPSLGQIKGLDLVSSGALTHSVMAADISLLFES